MREGQRSRQLFAVVAVLGALLWGGYVSSLGSADPLFERPQFDARYYSEWADQILSPDEQGERLFGGAFYRAPLYPYWLALLKSLFATAATAKLVAAIQVLLLFSSVLFLSWRFRRSVGPLASLFLLLLLFGYQPLLFFSTRYASEALAIPLLLFALGLVQRATGSQELGSRSMIVIAALLGLATLARPNLLLITLFWGGYLLVTRRSGGALRLMLVTALLIAPVAARNYLESGHAVLVSSNGGLTLMHGNGPGAVGVYTPVQGMTGSVAMQRQEATAMAIRLSGRQMDDVEADQFWKGRAISTRLADVAGSVRLSVSRLLLTLDRWEISLDESPSLDPNRFRPILWVPYALLLSLAAAGCHRSSRMPFVWLALLATLATPLVFYVSSRYRLPFAVLLTLPAACGAARLLERRAGAWMRAAFMLLLVLVSPMMLAQWMPYAEVRANEEAVAIAARAQAMVEWARGASSVSETQRREAIESTERQLLEALEISPHSGHLQFAFGSLLHATGRREEAVAAWLRAWQSDAVAGVRAGAASNVASDWIQSGSASAAATLMAEALTIAPLHEVCWNNRVVALATQGKTAEALSAVRAAQGRGVSISPELIEALVADPTVGGD